jgi:hypothetical protein
VVSASCLGLVFSHDVCRVPVDRRQDEAYTEMRLLKINGNCTSLSRGQSTSACRGIQCIHLTDPRVLGERSPLPPFNFIKSAISQKTSLIFGQIADDPALDNKINAKKVNPEATYQGSNMNYDWSR